MHPELFILHAGEHSWIVMSYTFFYYCATIFVIGGTFLATCRNGNDPKRLSILLFIVAVGGLIGARLWHVMTNWSMYAADGAHMFSLRMENFAIVGGLIGAILVGIIASKILHVDMWMIADRAVIFLGGGIALARVGCFLNGCCFGRVTHMPWGVQFPTMSNAHVHQIAHGEGSIFGAHSVHPTQIYELIFAIMGSIIAWLCIKKGYPPGVAAAAFGVWYALCRLVNMHFRVFPDSLQIPPFLYIFIYALIIVVCSLIIYKKSHVDHDMNKQRGVI